MTGFGAVVIVGVVASTSAPSARRPSATVERDGQESHQEDCRSRTPAR